jgi:hypothetical protein
MASFLKIAGRMDRVEAQVPLLTPWLRSTISRKALTAWVRFYKGGGTAGMASFLKFTGKTNRVEAKSLLLTPWLRF